MNYGQMIEHLSDLNRAELQRLAFEALLISDGPDHSDGDADVSIRVVAQLPPLREIGQDRNSPYFSLYDTNWPGDRALDRPQEVHPENRKRGKPAVRMIEDRELPEKDEE